MGVKILGIEYYLPSKTETLLDLGKNKKKKKYRENI